MKRPDLVFDVGMHRGEDTELYLARGFKVVGVEANPELVAEMEERFATQVRTGHLIIVSAAVASEPGTADFWVSDEKTDWSSMDPAYISRNETLSQTRYRTVQVPAIRFVDLLDEYGVPHYLKVDIEGADMLCVRALHDVRERPDYLSIESVVTAPGRGVMTALDELAELWALGYRGFKFIEQSRLCRPADIDVSGQFGEETRGRWMSVGPALARSTSIRTAFDLVGYGGRWGRTLPARTVQKFRIDVLKRWARWYDLHAKLGVR